MPSYGPPKICCLKVRSVLIFFSVIALILGLWEVTANEELVTRISGLVSTILDVVLLYGIIKNVSKTLKVSMYISLIHLTFDFGTILVSPVYFASQTASGYDSNDTYPLFPLILGSKSEEEDRFILGLVTGYSVEIISTISVFLTILQFVMINRCYVYSKRKADAVFQMNSVMKF